jgi:phosphonate transport system permease protein
LNSEARLLPLRHAPPPKRIGRPSALAFALGVALVLLVLHGIQSGAYVAPDRLVLGLVRAGELLAEAFPPRTDRLAPIARALLLTLEMAIIGTGLGLLGSLPLALLAARNTTPHPAIYLASRAMIGLFRTIPDIIWGVLFVVTVGLGPPAGVLAIAVDVMGFCGRFFAETIEEVDPGLVEGLRATGAGRGGIIAGAIVPASLPSFVATAMFALESSTRSSVVLGVVGAGGIGIELTVAMQLLRFDEAATIILLIFGVVLTVERLSALIRKRIL